MNQHEQLAQLEARAEAAERERDWERALKEALLPYQERAVVAEQRVQALEQEAMILQEEIDNNYIPRVVAGANRYDADTGRLGQRIGDLRQKLAALEAENARLRARMRELRDKVSALRDGPYMPTIGAVEMFIDDALDPAGKKSLGRLCVCGHGLGDHKFRAPEPCGSCGCDAFVPARREVEE